MARVKSVNLDDIISSDDVVDFLEYEMEKEVEDIRKNRKIKKGYAASTEKARKKAGLQTSYVDLTGNKKYSKKNWRFLDDWQIKMKSKYTAVVEWEHSLSKILLKAHSKRYGKLFGR